MPKKIRKSGKANAATPRNRRGTVNSISKDKNLYQTPNEDDELSDAAIDNGGETVNKGRGSKRRPSKNVGNFVFLGATLLAILRHEVAFSVSDCTTPCISSAQSDILVFSIFCLCTLRHVCQR